jgi:C4-type Zn-finger protein
MTLDFGFFGKKKTVEEEQEENERLRVQADNEDLRRKIALSQADRVRLREAGLTIEKDFGGSIARAWRWLNKTK